MGKVCVIIGASHASAQLSLNLRKNGWDGKIIVVGDEAYLPYQRPPLSKGFLLGDVDHKRMPIFSSANYEKNNIDFILNRRVINIDQKQSDCYIG